MLIAKNTCQWLMIGSTKLCDKKCMKSYCHHHAAKVRKGRCNTPCKVCGVGTRNEHSVCIKCGYTRIHHTIWMRGHRCIRAEFLRLSAIEILKKCCFFLITISLCVNSII